MENVNLGKKIENKERVKTIEIEIDGVKYPLECVSYDFEYPKNVQEETGILGYERIKILKESIENINVYDLFSGLSDGEYPKKCFNHSFSVYANKESEKNAYYEEFKKSKFFVQKIYSLDSRKRLGADSFNHKGISGQMSIQEVVSNNNEISRLDYRDLKDYYKGTKDLNEDGKYIFSELNFETSDFWGSIYHGKSEDGDTIKNVEDFGKKFGMMGFGFSMNDPFLKEYLEESLKHLKNIKGDRSTFDSVRHDHMERLNGVVSIIWDLVYFNEKVQKLLFDKENKGQISTNTIREVVDEAFSKIEEETSFPVSKFLSNNSNYYSYPIEAVNEHLDNKYEDDGLDYFKASFIQKIIGSRIKNIEGKHDNNAYLYQETHIPIFIEHDNLVQLSWGHAKYAHALDGDNFNFFTFKHADHLPTKKSVE